MATSLSLVAGARRSDGEREAFGAGSLAPRAVPLPPLPAGAEGRGGAPGANVSGERVSVLLPSPAAPTLSELFSASARDGGWAGFLLDRIAPGQPLLWVQERMAILEGGRIHPPGLGRIAEGLIHVEARDAKSVLWAMEEGLRCPALGAVIGELWGDPASLDFTATRRLAVAAEAHGVAAWLVRLGGAANLSGARWRWRVASAPSAMHELNAKAPGAPRWAAELFRARGHPPGHWVVGDEPTLSDAADHVDLAAATGPGAVAAAGGA